MTNRFEQGERKAILAYVRSVIERRLANLSLPGAPELEKLNCVESCFVTLADRSGNLRGCIGNIGAVETLGDNLQRNALNAAFNDPRFPSVEPDELPELTVEVSILTPMRKIASYTEFEAGKHGILLEFSSHHAVFLPQVATEQGWDEETTLNYLSQKAGLPSDTWKNPQAKFSVFEAEVFGEE